VLKDIFNRDINYLRISVTDRCDLRCQYCMKEKMEFLPKKEILSFEQIERLVDIFIERGIKKIRLTGGEPLVRKNIIDLINSIGKKINTTNLKELTLTTNGTLLDKFAKDIKKAGVKRINISLDTLDPIKYKEITRMGNIDNVFKGIESALENNIKIKINTVAIKNFNENELEHILLWCAKKGLDITFIEIMPMGETDHYRVDQHMPLNEIQKKFRNKYSLRFTDHKTGGPARYDLYEKYNTKVGYITPLSHTFCDNCNRMRITCTGRLYMCLGQEKFIDFKDVLNKDYSNEQINKLIYEAVNTKPKEHNFKIDKNEKPYISRFMNTTGG